MTSKKETSSICQRSPIVVIRLFSQAIATLAVLLYGHRAAVACSYCLSMVNVAICPTRSFLYYLGELFDSVLTGAGDTVSTVIRGTLWQVITPDHLRGRTTSVSMIFFMGGPQLGELEAGLAAAFFGVPFAIFSGGIAMVLLTIWVGWRFPQIRNYMGEDDMQVVGKKVA